ncbi:tetratricopeptide repeat protein [Dictyobacter alpinus]|uniref:Tetratricopeptide repeat protein n=1 Tax=Dictyobacter alpinus TaxID=2014873 RepID=A0A402BCY7_9CHLR|nr:tetratricopeptide repeat protein [Dictyobacter alpinus]
MTPKVRIPLIEARQQRQWSQQEVADRLGTTQNNVSRWERGITTPNPYFRAKICTLFGKSAQQLGLLEEKTPSTTNEKGTLAAVESSSASPPDKSTLWTVPYRRNPHFTGRDELLDWLAQQLAPQSQKEESRTRGATLSQPQAIKGLGGIGKTQLALEYAYQYAFEYRAVFWVAAETIDTIDASFTTIAEQLHLPEHEEKDRHKIIKAVLHWCATHKEWLLIFDNVESLSLVKPFLPTTRQGAILITTRLHALDGVALAFELPPFSCEEGIQFLLRRTGGSDMRSLSEQDSLELLKVAKAVVETMGGLPLALDQAGAYIERTGCSFTDYLHMYQSHHIQLLDERSALAEHPYSVVKTILFSFQKLMEVNEAAADLLRLCAFLAPDAIPEDLFTRKEVFFGPALDLAVNDAYRFNHVLGEALQYSLLYRQPQSHTLSLHRLVQVILKATMDETTSHLWISRDVALISASLLPFQEKHHGVYDDRYLLHAHSVLQHIEQWNGGEEQALLVPIWYYIGLVAEQYSQLTEAKNAYLQGLMIAHNSHSSLEAAFLVHAGFMMSDLGHDQQALQYLEQGAELARQTHDEGTLCFSLVHLGQIQDNLGNYQVAASLYQEGLAATVRRHDWAMASAFLQDLGIQLVRRGDYEQAEVLYREGLSYAQQSTHLGRQSALLMNLGMLAIHQQQYDQALTYSLESLALAQQVHNRYRISSISQNLGIIYRLLGQLEQAQYYLDEGLTLAQEIQHSWLIAETQGEYGWLYLEQKRFTEAKEMFEHMLVGAQHIQAPELIARALFGLARVASQQSRWEEARSLAQESLEHYTQLGDAQQDHISQWLDAFSSGLPESFSFQ